MNTLAQARPGTSLMLASFACGLLLHVDRTPAWCSVAALVAIAWHALHARGRIGLPGTGPRLLITLALVVAVAASFRTLSGLAAGSALLMSMGAAKLLETRQLRDQMVVAMVALVLLLAACLDRQTLLRLPLYLGAGWTAIASIAALGGTRAAQSPRLAYRTAGQALLWSAPLAVLCFVLVPRLPGAMWSMPGANQGTTGLADEMSPGSISELSLSDAVAFRARIQGPAPPPQQRYWRGPVLHDFDGHTWRRSLRSAAVSQEPQPASPALRQQIMLEPHGRLYLFALDSIQSVDGRRHRRTFDGQFLARQPVTSAIVYTAVSHLEFRHPGPLSHTARRLDTALPQGRNPRTLALAQQLRAGSSSDSDYAQTVLEHFRRIGLQYTLSPPLLGHHSVDELLFDTRLGFCGHFASAYVTLMRGAGVPARVVTGYMGGEWNPIGGYYVIRQSDAHAWAEVWLEGSGWTRIDPTAVVEPERMQRGLRDLMPDSGGAAGRLLRSASWLLQLRNAWDATSNFWQERVVNFNLSTQIDLLNGLGLGGIDYLGLTLLLLGGAMLWGALIWLRNGIPASMRPDPLSRTWSRFEKLLRRRGVQITPHEGPRHFAIRAARRYPAAATDILRFADDYLQLRFGPAALEGATARRSINALRLQLRRIARATAAGHHPRTTAATPE